MWVVMARQNDRLRTVSRAFLFACSVNVSFSLRLAFVSVARDRLKLLYSVHLRYSEIPDVIWFGRAAFCGAKVRLSVASFGDLHHRILGLFRKQFCAVDAFGENAYLHPMKLCFGLELDRSCYAGSKLSGSAGRHELGPEGLLDWLEKHFGLTGPARENEYLRIEEFRQICRKALAKHGEEALFFSRSFALDDFTTAADLLDRYDELLLAGWDFQWKDGMPHRLRCMAWLQELAVGFLSPGKADRLLAVEAAVKSHRKDSGGNAVFEEVLLAEPLALLPPYWRRLLPLLGPLSEAPVAEDEDLESDLVRFRRFLNGGIPTAGEARADGSLLILRTARAADAAAYVAALFKENPDFRPLCLVPDFSSRLDFAMVKEGLPSLGLQSVSLARPGLQLLKLAPAFLWEPIDPYKLMEFVSLPVKPLDDELAQVIARELAQAPGLRGERWQRSLAAFFADRLERFGPEQVELLRRQYNFWFVRKRYEVHAKAPKSEMVELFSYLARWAREIYDKGGEKQQSLLVLHAQARQLTELLEYLPEEFLSALELERLVRTVYQPAPVQFRLREAGSPDSVHHPAAIFAPAEDILWWDFTEKEPPSFFFRWYGAELRCLEEQGVLLETPNLQNRRRHWQQQLPVFKATRRLLLVFPESDLSDPCQAHALWSELRVAFGESLTKVVFRMADPIPFLPRLPSVEALDPQLPEKPGPFLRFRYTDWLDKRETETFSSLDDLFYYPYKWFFRYGLQLHKSPILSIVGEETLMGKLAHRLLENLLKEACLGWSRAELHLWIDRQIPILLQSEGAVLLMYGKEPERIRFVRRMKQASWFLLRQLQENAWEIVGLEEPLEGILTEGISIKGIADLVLKRGEETCVVDFKWRGLGYRRDLIRNEEDLQLVLYARLLPPEDRWAYTAFFILDRVELLARTQHAFRQIRPLAPDADPEEVNERIWAKMLRTFAWRRDQLSAGRVELRTRHTAEQLEELYREEGIPLMDLLEMKGEDARFDDYSVLLGLTDP